VIHIASSQLALGRGSKLAAFVHEPRPAKTKRHDAGGGTARGRSHLETIAPVGLQESGQRSACLVVFENQIGEGPWLVFR
jgi:hypothetical protein